MIFFRIFVTLLILLLQLILQQHSNTPVVLKINLFCLYFFPPIVENMNQEKLAKLQAQVRIGGKVSCKNEGILIAELVQHHLGHIKQGGYCSSPVRGYNYQLLLFFKVFFNCVACRK